MPDTTDTTENAADEASTEQESGSATYVDRQLLSDLSINVVPIVIIAAFVLVFGLLSSEGSGPLLLFHAGLIGGVVLVSAIAGWVISREDGELVGSAAKTRDTDSDSE